MAEGRPAREGSPPTSISAWTGSSSSRTTRASAFRRGRSPRSGAFRTYTDSDGCTYRMALDQVSAPQFIGSSVGSPEDWERLRPSLQADMSRFDSFAEGHHVRRAACGRPARPATRGCAGGGLFTVLVPAGALLVLPAPARGSGGAGEHRPRARSFAARVIAEYNAFTLRMVKLVLARGYRFDALWVFSDLCYKGGMLFSPRFYRAGGAAPPEGSSSTWPGRTA